MSRKALVSLGIGLLLSTGCTAKPADGPSAMAGSAGTPRQTSTSGASGGPASTAGTGVGAAGGSGRAAAVSGNGGGLAGSSGTGTVRAGSGGTAAVAGKGGASAAGSGGGAADSEHFSFFVTSLVAMQRLSGSEKGFGGDLKYGEADGLSGADKICTEIAEASMAGAGKKGWHAFLSVATGPGGKPVHAIDRVGSGPWYDRQGRLVAMDKPALMNSRPQGADSAIRDDLPNEFGVPNHRPDPGQPEVDNHHVLTGSDASGLLYQGTVDGTCQNWTSTASSAKRPRVGFSWIAGNRNHWISGQDEGGCGAGVALEENGGSDPNNPIVGSGGGYGAIYCFAMQP